MPPKTTFGGAEDPDRRRIDNFMAQIDPVLRPWLDQPDVELGIALSVGLGDAIDPLVHHDLDNFLEPLATRLGAHRIALAQASKAQGEVSTLAIGQVTDALPPPGGLWRSIAVNTASLGKLGQRSLGRAVAELAAPMPGDRSNYRWR